MDVDAFHRNLKALYLPPRDVFTSVEVPEIRFMAIDGEGDPNTSGMKACVTWLHEIACVVKPLIKARIWKRFAEPPFECLIWTPDPEDFALGRKDKWHWCAMVVLIDWISKAKFEEAVLEVSQKLGPKPDSLRIVEREEGRCVQTLHTGGSDGIRPLCERLFRVYLPENGLLPDGPYHEIYLTPTA